VIPLETETTFVILIHPRETRKRVGTGRMARLFLPNSELIDGVAFDSDPRILKWLSDPGCRCVVLFPGAQALYLNRATREERAALVSDGKRLVVFVIDGTWSTARTMLRQSPGLLALPQIAFEPERPSAYRIRQQPGAICLSTVEAIHTVLGLLEPSLRGEQDRMLEAFDWMVEQQLSYENRV
jgi:DTW domain-containing protein YfiP